LELSTNFLTITFKIQPWTPDHVVVYFSSGKVYEAFVIALLVEQGLIDYDDKIVKHWPEFAAKHKEKARFTIADLLRHDTSLAWFNDTGVEPEELSNPDFNQRLADMRPNNEGGVARRDYHAVTRGLLLNEIVKRVDPQHRTIGEMMEQELAKPLGVNHEQFRATGEADNIPTHSMVYLMLNQCCFLRRGQYFH